MRFYGCEVAIYLGRWLVSKSERRYEPCDATSVAHKDGVFTIDVGSQMSSHRCSWSAGELGPLLGYSTNVMMKRKLKLCFMIIENAKVSDADFQESSNKTKKSKRVFCCAQANKYHFVYYFAIHSFTIIFIKHWCLNPQAKRGLSFK